MVDFADVFRSYQSYLRVFETSSVVGKDGVSRVPASFSEFCGVYGNGTAREAVWDSHSFFRELGTSIQSSSVLLCTSDSASGQSRPGTGLGHAGVETASGCAADDAPATESSGRVDDLDNKNRESEEKEESAAAASGPVPGKNAVRNRRKRDLRKAAKKRAQDDGVSVPVWRRNARGNGSCPSLSGSVGSRTAVEVEAAQTLAARRVAENRVAILKAERTIKSFEDKEKTAALDTLEAAKVECRINVAMERSQKAYNNHDKSLKSVGSAASAGEFAFKKMVAKCAEQAELIASLTAQVDAALHASPGKVWEAVSAVPEARRISVRDILGEPDSKWSMKKTNTFYNILNAEAVGNYGSDWKDLF